MDRCKRKRKILDGSANELKSSGVKEVSLFCVDDLTGFRKAIGAVYPKARIHAIAHAL